MSHRRSKSCPRNPSRTVPYAFGSALPRDLSYLDFIPFKYRVYDVKIPQYRQSRLDTLEDNRQKIGGGGGDQSSAVERRNGHIYAFGSTTPREFSYLEGLQKEQKIYNAKLLPHLLNGERKSKTLTFASDANEGSALRRRSSSELNICSDAEQLLAEDRKEAGSRQSDQRSQRSTEGAVANRGRSSATRARAKQRRTESARPAEGAKAIAAKKEEQVLDGGRPIKRTPSNKRGTATSDSTVSPIKLEKKVPKPNALVIQPVTKSDDQTTQSAQDSGLDESELVINTDSPEPQTDDDTRSLGRSEPLSSERSPHPDTPEEPSLEHVVDLQKNQADVFSQDDEVPLNECSQNLTNEWNNNALLDHSEDTPETPVAAIEMKLPEVQPEPVVAEEHKDHAEVEAHAELEAAFADDESTQVSLTTDTQAVPAMELEEMPLSPRFKDVADEAHTAETLENAVEEPTQRDFEEAPAIPQELDEAATVEALPEADEVICHELSAHEAPPHPDVTPENKVAQPTQCDFDEPHTMPAELQEAQTVEAGDVTTSEADYEAPFELNEAEQMESAAEPLEETLPESGDVEHYNNEQLQHAEGDEIVVDQPVLERSFTPTQSTEESSAELQGAFLTDTASTQEEPVASVELENSKVNDVADHKDAESKPNSPTDEPSIEHSAEYEAGDPSAFPSVVHQADSEEGDEISPSEQNPVKEEESVEVPAETMPDAVAAASTDNVLLAENIEELQQHDQDEIGIETENSEMSALEPQDIHLEEDGGVNPNEVRIDELLEDKTDDILAGKDEVASRSVDQLEAEAAVFSETERAPSPDQPAEQETEAGKPLLESADIDESSPDIVQNLPEKEFDVTKYQPTDDLPAALDETDVDDKSPAATEGANDELAVLAPAGGAEDEDFDRLNVSSELQQLAEEASNSPAQQQQDDSHLEVQTADFVNADESPVNVGEVQDDKLFEVPQLQAEANFEQDTTSKPSENSHDHAALKEESSNHHEADLEEETVLEAHEKPIDDDDTAAKSSLEFNGIENSFEPEPTTDVLLQNQVTDGDHVDNTEITDNTAMFDEPPEEELHVAPEPEAISKDDMIETVSPSEFQATEISEPQHSPSEVFREDQSPIDEENAQADDALNPNTETPLIDDVNYGVTEMNTEDHSVPENPAEEETKPDEPESSSESQHEQALYTELQENLSDNVEPVAEQMVQGENEFYHNADLSEMTTTQDEIVHMPAEEANLGMGDSFEFSAEPEASYVEAGRQEDYTMPDHSYETLPEKHNKTTAAADATFDQGSDETPAHEELRESNNSAIDLDPVTLAEAPEDQGPFEYGARHYANSDSGSDHEEQELQDDIGGSAHETAENNQPEALDDETSESPCWADARNSESRPGDTLTVAASLDAESMVAHEGSEPDDTMEDSEQITAEDFPLNAAITDEIGDETESGIASEPPREIVRVYNEQNDTNDHADIQQSADLTQLGLAQQDEGGSEDYRNGDVQPESFVEEGVAETVCIEALEQAAEEILSNLASHDAVDDKFVDQQAQLQGNDDETESPEYGDLEISEHPKVALAQSQESETAASENATTTNAEEALQERNADVDETDADGISEDVYVLEQLPAQGHVEESTLTHSAFDSFPICSQTYTNDRGEDGFLQPADDIGVESPDHAIAELEEAFAPVDANNHSTALDTGDNIHHTPNGEHEALSLSGGYPDESSPLGSPHSNASDEQMMDLAESPDSQVKLAEENFTVSKNYEASTVQDDLEMGNHSAEDEETYESFGAAAKNAVADSLAIPISTKFTEHFDANNGRMDDLNGNSETCDKLKESDNIAENDSIIPRDSTNGNDESQVSFKESWSMSANQHES